MDTLVNILWALVFSLLGAIIGIFIFIKSASKLPQFFDRLTPNIDEGKEIARGNTAVSDYYGKVVGASIIGISLIIAAAVLGGIIAGLH